MLKKAEDEKTVLTAPPPPSNNNNRMFEDKENQSPNLSILAKPSSSLTSFQTTRVTEKKSRAPKVSD
jgi:hypothetical protein